jgi:hypothetical protein
MAVLKVNPGPPFPESTFLSLASELSPVGSAGLLSSSEFLFLGSLGPGRGVVSELSDSSSAVGEREDEADSSEYDSGDG